MLPTASPRFLRLRWLVFGLLSSAFVLAFFHRVAPTVLAEELAISLNASAVALGSIAAMYFHIYAAMQIPAGIITDRLGTRATVGLSTGIGGIGSIIFALAPDVFTASVGRFIIGFGVAFAFVGTLRAVGYWFRPEQYAQVSGWIILVGNMGAILAGTPLAFSLQYFSWRTAFLIVGVFSLLLAIVIIWLVRDTPQDAGFTSSGADHAPHENINFLQGIMACIRLPAIWLCFLAGFALVGSFFGFAGIWAVPFLMHEVGLSAREAADCLTLSLLLLAFSPAFIGWFSDHIRNRKLIIVLSCLTGTLTWVIFGYVPNLGFWGACLVMTLGGIACCGMVVIYATAKDLAPASAAGFAVALVNTGLFTGAALLQIWLGWLLSLNGYTPDGNMPPDFSSTMLSLVLVSLAGFIATLWIPETHPRNPKLEPEPV